MKTADNACIVQIDHADHQGDMATIMIMTVINKKLSVRHDMVHLKLLGEVFEKYAEGFDRYIFGDSFGIFKCKCYDIPYKYGVQVL